MSWLTGSWRGELPCGPPGLGSLEDVVVAVATEKDASRLVVKRHSVCIIDVRLPNTFRPLDPVGAQSRMPRIFPKPGNALQYRSLHGCWLGPKAFFESWR